MGSRRRGGGRFEVVGGQETRLIHSPPQAHTRFFLFFAARISIGAHGLPASARLLPPLTGEWT